MLTPTTYQLVRGGQVRYLVFAIVLGSVGLFVLSGLFTDQAQAQNHGWPVYVFAGLTITLWLGFAAYYALRAFKSTARVIVDTNGFSYEGIVKTSWFPWKDITTTRWVYDRGGFEWLEITIKHSDQKSRSVKLDFSGLRPDRLAFVNQVRTLAPWVEAKWN